MRAPTPVKESSFFDQPKAVWATAFACVVGFMSIGLVDPILTSIAEGLDATASQVSLLFSSYFLVTSLMMLVTGFVSSRLGGRRTLLVGAGLIVVFAALSGTSNSVTELVLYRGGWGFGNALFVATALAVIVAASRSGTRAAVLVYEAAMGIGLSAGPLIGAALGTYAWRYPFFGTATLMAIGFVAIAIYLPEQPKAERKTSLSAPLRALTHPGLFVVSASAFFYYYAFFTVLAFVPFVLQLSAHTVGLIFFGWGLLLAVFSVIVVPRLQARFGALVVIGTALIVLAALLAVMSAGSKSAIAVCVVLSGAVMGICNTVYTEMAMEVSDVPRPVASAGYNFLRWIAGVAAPLAAPALAEHFGTTATFSVATFAALAASGILFGQRRQLSIYGHLQVETPRTVEPAMRPLVMAAIDGSPQDGMVVRKAIEIARSVEGWIAMAHVQILEVAGEEVIAAETDAESESIIARSMRIVEESGIVAAAMLLEAPDGLAPKVLLERAQAIGARSLVVGVPHGNAIDVIHGSFSRAAQQLPHSGLELVLAS